MLGFRARLWMFLVLCGSWTAAAMFVSPGRFWRTSWLYTFGRAWRWRGVFLWRWGLAAIALHRLGATLRSRWLTALIGARRLNAFGGARTIVTRRRPFPRWRAARLGAAEPE